jgi:hypothetical protein
MLVHRFGILRKPMPVNIRVSQISSLVTALCRLHNYCIDMRDIQTDTFIAKDLFFQVINGGDSIEGRDDNYNYDQKKDRAQLLLDGGQHFTDVVLERKRMLRDLEDTDKAFPYRTVHHYIHDNHFARPTPRKTKHTPKR